MPNFSQSKSKMDAFSHCNVIKLNRIKSKIEMAIHYLFDPLSHFGKRFGPSRLRKFSADDKATDRQAFEENRPVRKGPCKRLCQNILSFLSAVYRYNFNQIKVNLFGS